MAGPVLVDTSVWVDALRDPRSRVTPGIEALLAGTVRLATTGLIVQEVLQGISVPADLARVGTLMRHVPCLGATRDTHMRAASLYRGLRRAGVTVPTVDVVIAQLAIDHGVPVWSLDRHFARIARASRLRLYTAR